MMIDIVFSACNRLEFTKWALEALERNTDWAKVHRFYVYVDVRPKDDEGKTAAYLREWFLHGSWLLTGKTDIKFTVGIYGGPVEIMKAYLRELDRGDVFVKIDNDVIVPPGWVGFGADVMHSFKELDLLGIEPPASRTAPPWNPHLRVQHPENVKFKLRTKFLATRGTIGYAPTDMIGGIGFMRAAAFENRPEMKPFATYGGFSDWQVSDTGESMVKGWVYPSMGQLFLLDRLPMDPYASLSRQYIKAGWQRPWTHYTGAAAQEMAGWWLERQNGKA